MIGLTCHNALQGSLVGALALLASLAPVAEAASADVVVATRPILAQSVIRPADIRVKEGSSPGALSDPAKVIGMEARTTIYAGRAITPGDLRNAAIVERNDIVVLSYQHGPLMISTEGRALDRGAVGDRIRVMNLSSRMIISGHVTPDAAVAVAR